MVPARGLVACVLNITIPFGVAAFRLAGYAVWPFGRRVEVHRDAGVASVVGNIRWVLLLGWELSLAHLIAGVLCVTIVGIPLGVASFKMWVLALVPVGTRGSSTPSRRVPGIG